MSKPANHPTPAVTIGNAVLKRLFPDSPGTKSWQEKHGKSPICVRYRQGEKPGCDHTTVEIVTDEQRYSKSSVRVRISHGETNLRPQARELGGESLSECRLWRLPLPAIGELRLQNCIAENCQ